MQRWLSYYSSLGVLTRQAIESMVPVALLKPQGQHRVLDMCASPGSKTTQALEAIWADGDPAAAGGFVVANDSVRSRCSMLLRRCAALGECAKVLMVVTHKAQCLPPLHSALSAATDAYLGVVVPDRCGARQLTQCTQDWVASLRAHKVADDEESEIRREKYLRLD